MRIAYVEDEKIQAELLVDYLKEYSDDIIIDYFMSGDEFLFKTENAYPYDLILLDIQMKGTSGMDVAKKIRQSDSNVCIVFLTAIKDYVFEGYEVNAYRYLLKPIQKNKLFELLDAIPTEKHYCLITMDKMQYKLVVEDIMYIESEGHYIHIYTKDKAYMVRDNFNTFIKLFLTFDFIQTHRSYMVNLAYISQMDKDNCILDDGRLVPISRQQKKIVMESFMNYFRSHLR